MILEPARRPLAPKNEIDLSAKGWSDLNEQAEIEIAMLEAVESVTGCTVNLKSVSGDAGVKRGTLDCD